MRCCIYDKYNNFVIIYIRCCIYLYKSDNVKKDIKCGKNVFIFFRLLCFLFIVI